MRPITLEMHAFGPYARSQKLDFREFGDRPLFLIHGPTGSGKSSILDAICFALYGETSGDERKSGQMRSDHAYPDHSTRVVFEFSLGNVIYKIDRSPPQEVPRRDGKGVRADQHKAQMWERHGLEDQYRVLASNPTGVGEQVERLLGLRADQFRQVVVLPQGRFRELLTANSTEREKIFSTLFQTRHYRDIQDRLKDRAQGIKRQLDEHHQQQRTVLDVAGVESREELTGKIAGVDQAIAGLTEQRTAQETTATTAREALEKGREADGKLREVDDARKKVRDLEAREEQTAYKRTALDQAKKAAQLTDAEANLMRRIDEAKKSEELRDGLELKLATATTALEGATGTKEQADELQPQIEVLQGNQRDLDALRPRIARLSGAEEDLTNAQEKVREQETAHETAKGEHEQRDKELKTAQEQFQSASLQAGLVDGLKSQRDSLKRLSRQRGRLDELQQELKDARDVQDKATTALETTTDHLRNAEQTLDVLEGAWRRGQAAVLAGGLAADEPCPVCGSVHHPQPASSDEAIPDEEQLEYHRQAVQTARNNQNHASNNKVAKDGYVKMLSEQVDQLREELGDTGDTPAEQLDRELRDVDQRLTLASTEAESVDGLFEKVEQLDATVRDLEQQVAKIAGTMNVAREVEASARTSYENALAELPEAYRSLETLDAAIEAAKNELGDLNEHIEAANKALEEANSEYSDLSTRLQSAKTEAETDRERADESAECFAQRRLEQGFADDAAYQAARLPQEHVDQLDTQISQYDELLSNARYSLKTAEQNAEGLQRPDLDALGKVLTDADAELGRIRDELANQNSQLQNLKHASDQIEEITGAVQKLENEYEVAEYLSGVATGDAAYSNHRVSFERFVLSAFLDEVLDYATHRLYGMSEGRFRLVRKTEGGDRRRSTGLDLEIEDAYTGTSRDVSTLSGGEGFLAALAMALGLSEVVQSRSGGIRLQTLFVDEGFGSLDPDALDRSLTTLVDLQHGRLVGIISHVPELQERVDAKLSVEAGRNGSTARITI